MEPLPELGEYPSAWHPSPHCSGEYELPKRLAPFPPAPFPDLGPWSNSAPWADSIKWSSSSEPRGDLSSWFPCDTSSAARPRTVAEFAREHTAVSRALNVRQRHWCLRRISMASDNDWSAPKAMAIPKEGYFTPQQGRYGATY